MLLPNSVAAKAALAFLMADAVLGDPLATIDPCPGAEKLSLAPITVTSQYQPVSTCQPTTACVKGKCSTTYPFTTYPWVSTVVPYAWNGTTSQTTTVTATDQPLRVSEYLETLTSVTAAPTAGKRSWVDWVHKKPELKEVTIYETVTRRAVVPYHEAGPLCIPGWEGSGLCKKCQKQPDGSRYQLLDVVECRSGTSGSGKHWKKCSEWYETVIQRPAPTSTVTASALCSSQGKIPEAGTYTWTFPQTAPAVTITAPARTVTVTVQGHKTVTVEQEKVYTIPGKSWNAYVTKSYSGPSTFSFNVVITKVIIFNIPHSTQPAKSTHVIPVPTGSHNKPGSGWWPLPDNDKNGNAYYGGGKGWVDWSPVPGTTTTSGWTASSSSSASGDTGPIGFTTTSSSYATSTTTAIDSPILYTTTTSSTSGGGDTGPIGFTTSSSSSSSTSMGNGVDGIGGSRSTSSFSTGFSTSTSSGGDTGPIGGFTSTTSSSDSASTTTSGGDTGPIGGSTSTTSSDSASTTSSGSDTGPIGGSTSTTSSDSASTTSSGGDTGPIGGSTSTTSSDSASTTSSGGDTGPIGGSTSTTSSDSASTTSSGGDTGPIGGSTTASTSSTSTGDVGPIGGSTTTSSGASQASTTSSGDVGPIGGTTTTSSLITASSTTSAPATTTTSTGPICNLNANICLDSQLITANIVSTVTCPLLGGLLCTVNDLLTLVPTLLGGNPNVLSVLVGNNEVIGLSITPEQVAAAINAGELNGLCGLVPEVSVLINDPTCPTNPTTSTTSSLLSTTTPLVESTTSFLTSTTPATTSFLTTTSFSTTSAPATTTTSASPVCEINASICPNAQLITASTVATQNCPLLGGLTCTVDQLLSLVPALLGGNPNVLSVLVSNNQVLGLSITPDQLQAAINAGELTGICSVLEETSVTIYDPTCINNPTTSSTTSAAGATTTSALVTTTSAATTTVADVTTTTTSALTTTTTASTLQCGVAITLCAGQTLADVGLSTVTCNLGIGLLCDLTQTLDSVLNACVGNCGVIGRTGVLGLDLTGLVGLTDIQAIQAAVGATPNCQPGGQLLTLSDPGCPSNLFRRSGNARPRRY